jgi:hypothetical protein
VAHHHNHPPITVMAAKKKKAESGSTGTDDPPVIYPGDLGIPHHMQDKHGFCGAACMMMVLGYQGTEQSQSELMRLIKGKREDYDWKKGKNGRASDRVAWHASPDEIAAVMTDLAPSFPWVAKNSGNSDDVLKCIDQAVDGEGGYCPLGVIALVWSANLDTQLPHWVVVSGKTSGENGVEGYWILDPTACNRPDGVSRYESWMHPTIREKELCPCQSWKDSNGRERTAERIWVAKDKMAELLDDGAVKGNGLRYAVIAKGLKLDAGGTDRPGSPPAMPKGPKIDLYKTDLTSTVGDRITAKKTEAEATIFAQKFKDAANSIVNP